MEEPVAMTACSKSMMPMIPRRHLHRRRRRPGRPRITSTVVFVHEEADAVGEALDDGILPRDETPMSSPTSGM